eukprot:CAMPEP_0116899132 /NCGR_PEP_ID=MMETSP0467-20121206/7755_1 /TAXON_ID=283647 /ORGANISM="Mesodinium pulex, Strain SPMC105" /LENGTH=60 /DNA_ID=CAMNT_0004571755 /DNA_START=1054 /DNA_END=1236 /DNA_ORIENTATION=-
MFTEWYFFQDGHTDKDGGPENALRDGCIRALLSLGTISVATGLNIVSTVLGVLFFWKGYD